MRRFLLGWTHGDESGYSEVSAVSPVDAFRQLRQLLPMFGAGLRIVQIMETT